ncbi:MAG: BolA family protein [Casimicrobiaceae bacterium]
MTLPTPEQIRTWIAESLDCQHLEVEGDGQHFQALIVSTGFEGLPLVRRQQQVYAALGERMRTQIHALSMKTLTPAEWAERAARGGHGG